MDGRDISFCLHAERTVIYPTRNDVATMSDGWSTEHRAQRTVHPKANRLERYDSRMKRNGARAQAEFGTTGKGANVEQRLVNR